MKMFNIKITGNGTFKEIAKSLQDVVDEMNFIDDANGAPYEDIEWETPILMIEIKAEE
jgi:hypothetical protein